MPTPQVPAEPTASRPLGIGEYPSDILQFFNWGAFSQPLLWGVVYGVWPIVTATLLAGSVPYFVLLAMGVEQAASASTQFGVMAISGVLAAMVRIWAGMVANERAWARESAIVIGSLAGKPRRTIGWFVERQILWMRIGMIALLAATGLAAYMDYGILAQTSATLALYAVAQHVLWLGASVVGATWMIRQDEVSQNSANTESDSSSNQRGANLPGSEEIQAVIGQFHTLLGIGDPVTSGTVAVNPIRLRSGATMPPIGLGTYKTPEGPDTVRAVSDALIAGYRSIDTASFYQNERSVGLAVRDSGIPRSEIFVSSKMWNDEQGYAATVRAFDQSLSELGLRYLDLYLVHWPVESTLEPTWRALEHLHAARRALTIGVCNFEIHHLEALRQVSEVVPMVNQIELHPRFQRTELVDYCRENGIAVQAWAPLARGGVFEVDELREIGAAHGKTAGQVAIRWSLQEGYCPLPKSVSADRIYENFDVFDFALSDEEMAVIRALDRGERLGPDPEQFSWKWPESQR